MTAAAFLIPAGAVLLGVFVARIKGFDPISSAILCAAVILIAFGAADWRQ